MTNHHPTPGHDHVDPPHLGNYGAPCCCCGARWTVIGPLFLNKPAEYEMIHRPDCPYLNEAYPDGDTDLSRWVTG